MVIVKHFVSEKKNVFVDNKMLKEVPRFSCLIEKQPVSNKFWIFYTKYIYNNAL